jgi:two-component system response regulator DevR
MPEEIRLMLVDDHEVVRQGLKALLERRMHLQIVAEAGTVAEAVAEAARVQPDVIVMDVRLPDGTGIEACRDIRADRPATRVLMLTSYSDDEAVYASIVAGAAGYLLKQTRGRELVGAIEAVARGESLLDPAVTSKVLARMRELATGGHRDKLAELTEQERRILGLIAEGKTNREIAGTIYLSEKTVKNYVSTILSKLGMERRAQAAAFLAEQRARGHE